MNIQHSIDASLYSGLKNYFLNIVAISSEEWEEFEKGLFVKKHAKGDVLIREGQTCRFVTFINYGSVRAYELVDGIEVNRTFFSDGFFATEYKSFITQQPSHEYLEVLEPTELVWIDYHLLQDMYARFKSFERLGRMLAEMLYVKMREKVMVLRVNTPEERYQIMMKESPHFIQKIQHYHLASYLGITPQSLSRIRKRLK